MAHVRTSGRYPAGATVTLHRRVGGDWLSASDAANPLQTTTADEQGFVVFDNVPVPAGTDAWVIGPDGQRAAVTVKAPPRSGHPRHDSRVPPELAGQTHPTSPTGSTEGPPEV